MKLNRYSKALQLIGKVIKGKKEELVATIFIMLFIIVISSTMIYYLENPV
jgi:voltage-gated potassium channel